MNIDQLKNTQHSLETTYDIKYRVDLNEENNMRVCEKRQGYIHRLFCFVLFIT
jgi:hypothetical protein